MFVVVNGFFLMDGGLPNFHRRFQISEEFFNVLYFTFSRPAISITMDLHCEANELLRRWSTM